MMNDHDATPGARWDSAIWPDPWDGHPRWELVPAHLREGLRAYVEQKREPGGFLMAVLRNDLSRAVGYADDASMVGLRDLLHFLWAYAPASCWGSKENADKWLAEGVEERRAEEQASDQVHANDPLWRHR